MSRGDRVRVFFWSHFAPIHRLGMATVIYGLILLAIMFLREDSFRSDLRDESSKRVKIERIYAKTERAKDLALSVRIAVLESCASQNQTRAVLRRIVAVSGASPRFVRVLRRSLPPLPCADIVAGIRFEGTP